MSGKPITVPQMRQNCRNAPAVEAMSTRSCVLATAGRLFPSVSLVGGKPTPFVELNQDRPPRGFDFITHATQATTHDADDLTVMGTLEASPSVIRLTPALAAGAALRIGPATIGRSKFSATAAPLPNLNRQPVCNAADDSRQEGLFGTAFALGYAARSAREGVEGLTLAAACGPFGIFVGPDDAALPLCVGNRRVGAPSRCVVNRNRNRVGAAACSNGGQSE